MKRLLICWIIGIWVAMLGCKPELPAEAAAGDTELFPDYKGVTIPVNIAPLNFKLLHPRLQGIARLQVEGEELILADDQGAFLLPEPDWQRLVWAARGKQIDVTLYFREPDAAWQQMEFPIYVSTDSVDGYLTYRRIFPGYRTWNEMGIYQRSLENFQERTILANDMTDNSCMNCHSFCAGAGDRMLFHQRGTHNGTYLVEGQQVKRITMERDGRPASFVYPYWHPEGRYVAFSTNDTHQDFHLSDPNRIEVFDSSSDVLLYDTRQERAFSIPALSSKACYETFPTFTPDGRSLLFCSADSVVMPAEYRQLRYHLLRIAFDPHTGTFGNTIDTLYHAGRAGRSAKFPRVSPDGRYLLYTLSDYGNFSIWHKDADLYRMDLQTGRTDSLPGVNSPDVESYHSWSSNSRWFVFASRRQDGLFTRPYLVHVDEQGRCGKPFLLPQAHPDAYMRSLFSYNIPELSRTPTRVSQSALLRVTRSDTGRIVRFVP